MDGHFVAWWLSQPQTTEACAFGQVAARSGDMRRMLEACSLALDALVEESSSRQAGSPGGQFTVDCRVGARDQGLCCSDL